MAAADLTRGDLRALPEAALAQPLAQALLVDLAQQGAGISHEARPPP